MGGCKNKKLIGPYLDGQLGECRWLDEHISECSQCLAEYEAIQKLNHLAGKVDFAPPESHYWKNFSARTMARIATREAQTVKSRGWLFFTGYKVPIRVFSLVAALVLVVGASLTILNYRERPNLSGVSLTHSGNQTENKLNNSEIVNLITPNPAIAEPAIKQIPDKSIALTNTAIASNNVVNRISEQPLSQAFNSNSELRGQFRYTSRAQANLVEPDVPIGIGTIQSDLSEPNSDMIIVYQINKGSRAGEIPLLVYRQATVKFLGPDKAMPWRNINRVTGPSWGYAAGDGQANEQYNKRLNMELDLSQDK
jgi:hypothetical protein